MTDVTANRLLRLNQVRDISGLSKAMIYRLVSEGKFPVPCKPGGITSRWVESEVMEWRQGVEQARAA